MRIALYARVSKDDGRMDTENQMHELRELCVRNGWEIAAEYVDQMSGRTGNRPRFKEMFAAAVLKKFDMVLFWSLDRFSREGALATLQYLEKLTAYGVGWRSYQETYLDSCGPLKDVVVSLMATIAKQERVRISERTKAGLRTAVRKGVKLGRPVVVVSAVAIRKMQAGGMSLREIADKEGWSLSTVVRCLRRGRR